MHQKSTFIQSIFEQIVDKLKVNIFSGATLDYHLSIPIIGFFTFFYLSYFSPSKNQMEDASTIAYSDASNLESKSAFILSKSNLFSKNSASERIMNQPTCLLDNIGMSRMYGDANSQDIGDDNADDENDDDFISFINFGPTAVDISGWELYVDQNGTGSPVFTFPASTVVSPCDEITVISDWNGANPLPSNWFDADFASGEGMFEDNSANTAFAILRNPSSNEYISIHHNVSTPVLGTGTLVCEYDFNALISTEFNGCEMVYWNASTNIYTVITDCTIYNAYTACLPLVEICNNGVDDDGDGDIDCADDDCYLSVNSGDGDNDNDSVGNICDLDDDNDGIPDLEECNGTFVLDDTHAVSTFTTTQLNSTSSGVQHDINLLNGITFNTSTGPNLGNTTFGPPAPFNGSQNYLYLEINTDQNVADHGTYTITFPSVVVNPTIYFSDLSSGFSSPNWSLTLINQTPEASMNLIYTDGEFLISGDTIRASVVTSTNGSGVVEFTGIVQQLQFKLGHYSPTNQDGIVRFATNVGFTLCDDIDSDGVPSMYDLDSDNDGIFDVDEAGHSAADANDDGVIDGVASNFGSNGLFDALETTVDSDLINYTIANSETTPDGIYDAYELDADGDGCFDAEEGGVADADLDGIAGTGVPVVDGNTGLVTSITYVHPSNNIWQNPAMGPCLTEICNDGIDNDLDGLTDCLDCNECVNSLSCTDSDGDNINDLCDLDDDNDGIPDLEECAQFSSSGLTGPLSGFTTKITTTDSSNATVSHILDSITYAGVSYGNFILPDAYSSNFTIVDSSRIAFRLNDLIQFDYTTPNYNTDILPAFQSRDLGAFQDVNSGNDYSNGDYYDLSYNSPIQSTAGVFIATTEQNGNNPQIIQAMDINGNLIGSTISVAVVDYLDLGVTIRGSGSQNSHMALYPIEDLVPAGTQIHGLRISFGPTATNDGPDSKVFIFGNANVALCDFDGDGIPNTLDLDSDNDGIFDLDEAGHTAADTNSDGVIDGASNLFGTNGLFNALETMTDNGIINYTVSESEITPEGFADPYDLDSDGDGCFDAEEEGVADPDLDGIASTGVPDVDGNTGLVTSITYVHPSNNIWQNPALGPCLTEICNDGIDNDADGSADCDDTDCPCCEASAPLLAR